jgi:DNA-binding transcriptional MerR regulator
MGKILTSKDVCQRLGIPFYKLQYLFDSGKVRDVDRISTGDRIYTEADIQRIRKALFGVTAK